MSAPAAPAITAPAARSRRGMACQRSLAAVHAFRGRWDSRCAAVFTVVDGRGRRAGDGRRMPVTLDRSGTNRGGDGSEDEGGCGPEAGSGGVSAMATTVERLRLSALWEVRPNPPDYRNRSLVPRGGHAQSFGLPVEEPLVHTRERKESSVQVGVVELVALPGATVCHTAAGRDRPSPATRGRIVLQLPRSCTCLPVSCPAAASSVMIASTSGPFSSSSTGQHQPKPCR